MREYSTYIPFSMGLRPYGANKNSEFLVQCHNVKVWKSGLLEYSPVVDPIDYPSPVGVWVSDWPFPKTYAGFSHNLGIIGSGIYAMDALFVPGALQIAMTGTTKVSITDYYDYMLVCNGSKTYERDATTGVWSNYTALDASCICDFKGQLILGQASGRPTNSVSWSRIGEIDLTIDRMNTAGWMPMNWAGEVYDVRRLGNSILVSGSGGVTALLPVAEPTIGFRRIDLLKSGLLAVEAVGGGGDDTSPVLLISEFGEAWLVKPDLSMENLGYVEFFSALGSDTVVTYSDHEKVFFISDGTVSYMLTQFGLSTVFQCVSNVQSYGGTLISAVKALTDVTAYAKTEPTDFGLRAIKSIGLVELDAIGSGFTIGLYSETQLGGSVFELASQPVNPVGVCTSKISGLNLAFKVTNATYAGKIIKGIHVRYKLTDKRFLRGPYADSPNARTGS
jgi:hypothetical protein